MSTGQQSTHTENSCCNKNEDVPAKHDQEEEEEEPFLKIRDINSLTAICRVASMKPEEKVKIEDVPGLQADIELLLTDVIICESKLEEEMEKEGWYGKKLSDTSLEGCADKLKSTEDTSDDHGMDFDENRSSDSEGTETEMDDWASRSSSEADGDTNIKMQEADGSINFCPKAEITPPPLIFQSPCNDNEVTKMWQFVDRYCQVPNGTDIKFVDDWLGMVGDEEMKKIKHVEPLGTLYCDKSSCSTSSAVRNDHSAAVCSSTSSDSGSTIGSVESDISGVMDVNSSQDDETIENKDDFSPVNSCEASEMINDMFDIHDHHNLACFDKEVQEQLLATGLLEAHELDNGECSEDEDQVLQELNKCISECEESAEHIWQTMTYLKTMAMIDARKKKIRDQIDVIDKKLDSIWEKYVASKEQNTSLNQEEKNYCVQLCVERNRLLTKLHTAQYKDDESTIFVPDLRSKRAEDSGCSKNAEESGCSKSGDDAGCSKRSKGGRLQ